MYVIIVYDVSAGRVTKVCHFLRQYLDWMQNSVFEGELTLSQMATIENRLKSLVDESTDSVQVYSFLSKDAFKKKTIGVPKAEPTAVI